MLVLLGVSVIVFALLRLTPGDPAELMLGDMATPQAIQELRTQLGLNDPLPVQYGRFLMNAMHGDLGTSIRAQRPVISYVLERYPATLELSAVAMMLAIVLGIPIGVLSAVKRYSVVDNLAMFFSLLAQSMPGFWLGLMLIIVFAVQLRVLPVSGNATPIHVILPGLTLAMWLVGLIVRLTRSAMLDVLRQDYMRTARAKGLAERVVLYRHAIKNAMIPIVTVLGLQVGALLGGAVITETVFAWPGIGQLAITAIRQRDYPVVQAIVLITAASFVFVNFLVDVLYFYLDPRISRQ